ncbi:hemerythrin domain-containing protein [Vibrio renipiscarius]|uniref:Cation-binding protein n=1 Tax=Vibrio renipiscarius TaxID=1461322 RepID=A0A0C2KDF3_9VIBR|nr:hemerythrin domain-containing protein [Vibrio renipiscarius]KII79882.1 cation-binding protein [Vibrio renipiscarius]KII80143.1 cation-binding protein [Vibrio renipiscarius]
MMIEQIRREHSYIVRLLAILANKVDLLKQEQPVNYSLIKEVVDYLSEYSEKHHHPKEDILYHYYREHYGAREDMDNLAFEHKLLECKTHAFMNIVEMILQDAVVPHHLFIEQLESFMHAQKDHLTLEETTILPMICERFIAEDWQKVQSQYTGDEDDPVFGETIAEHYAQLAKRVRETG